jgi:glyoxylase-like metal-dependent hydrolase (beta-lactamase superfamily II)
MVHSRFAGGGFFLYGNNIVRSLNATFNIQTHCMKLTTIQKGFYQINLGYVNAFLVATDNGLVLVDSGTEKHAEQVVKAIGLAGYAISDLKHIILTHHHPDHIGSAARLQGWCGAKVYAHVVDADLIEQGIGKRPDRPLKPSPGFLAHFFALLMPLFSRSGVPPVTIDQRVQHGDRIIGDFEVIFTPGHSSGHICLLYHSPQGKVLIAADLCMNIYGLDWSFVYEDRETGRNSIAQIAAIQFDCAVFGHGRPILNDASGIFSAAHFWK